MTELILPINIGLAITGIAGIITFYVKTSNSITTMVKSIADHTKELEKLDRYTHNQETKVDTRFGNIESRCMGHSKEFSIVQNEQEHLKLEMIELKNLSHTLISELHQIRILLAQGLRSINANDFPPTNT